MRVLALSAVLAAAGCALAANCAPAAAPPAVAAAADLRFAMDELLAEFRRAGGGELRVTYGSSGNFVRQIAEGAPFELFFSADEEFVFRLAQQGLTRDRGVLYAIGRIVLFAPAGSRLTPTAELAGLGAFLAANPEAKIAIANPEHAPYGRAAQQALRARGQWEAIQSHLVLGENVSQAAQFAVSGAAAGGIIAYSLALAPEFRGKGSFALIPAELHRPLRQRVVLLKGSGSMAGRFYEFLQREPARAVLKRFGFDSP